MASPATCKKARRFIDAAAALVEDGQTVILLPAMAGYKTLPGMEGATYYYYDIPKNPVNDWLVAEHQKRFNAPPDFFTASTTLGNSASTLSPSASPGADRPAVAIFFRRKRSRSEATRRYRRRL